MFGPQLPPSTFQASSNCRLNMLPSFQLEAKSHPLPLPFLFPMSGMFFPAISSFAAQFCSHLLQEAFLDARNPRGHPGSPWIPCRWVLGGWPMGSATTYGQECYGVLSRRRLTSVMGMWQEPQLGPAVCRAPYPLC